MTGCAGWRMMPALRPRTPTKTLLARIGQDLHDGPIQLVSLLMLKLTNSSRLRNRLRYAL